MTKTVLRIPLNDDVLTALDRLPNLPVRVVYVVDGPLAIECDSIEEVRQLLRQRLAG